MREKISSSSRDIGSLLRFVVVGLVQNGISILLLAGGVALGLQPWQSFTLIFPIAVLGTYYANKLWTFEQRPARQGTFSGYVLAYGSAYLLAIAISYVLTRLTHLDYLNLVLTVGLVGVYTFVTLDRLVFKRAAKDEVST